MYDTYTNLHNDRNKLIRLQLNETPRRKGHRPGDRTQDQALLGNWYHYLEWKLNFEKKRHVYHGAFLTQAVALGHRGHRSGSLPPPPPHSRCPCCSSSNMHLTLKVKVDTQVSHKTHFASRISCFTQSCIPKKVYWMCFTFFLLLALRADVSGAHPSRRRHMLSPINGGELFQGGKQLLLKNVKCCCSASCAVKLIFSYLKLFVVLLLLVGQ